MMSGSDGWLMRFTGKGLPGNIRWIQKKTCFPVLCFPKIRLANLGSDEVHGK